MQTELNVPGPLLVQDGLADFVHHPPQNDQERALSELLVFDCRMYGHPA